MRVSSDKMSNGFVTVAMLESCIATPTSFYMIQSICDRGIFVCA
jgi:hypothetical protein